jgi:hypothetical protein
MIWILSKDKFVVASGGRVGGTSDGITVAMMGEWVHAVVGISFVVCDWESDLFALCKAPDWDCVGLDGAGDVVGKVAKSDSWKSFAIGSARDGVVTNVTECIEIGAGHVPWVEGGTVIVDAILAISLFVEDENVHFFGVGNFVVASESEGTTVTTDHKAGGDGDEVRNATAETE